MVYGYASCYGLGLGFRKMLWFRAMDHKLGVWFRVRFG